MEVPIKANKVILTSGFGNRTYTLNGKKVNDDHKGDDIVERLNNGKNNNDAEILAFADGTVTTVVNKGEQYGTMCQVVLKHSNGYYTRYYHLKSGSIVVKVGDKVKKGQKLGIIGKTGKATGVHLHFQIDKGSKASAIDPYDYLFKGKVLFQESNSTSSTTSASSITKDEKASPSSTSPSTSTTSSISHKVVRGDTISDICVKYYKKYTKDLGNKIVNANKKKYPDITLNYIQAGWILTIPE